MNLIFERPLWVTGQLPVGRLILDFKPRHCKRDPPRSRMTLVLLLSIFDRGRSILKQPSRGGVPPPLLVLKLNSNVLRCSFCTFRLNHKIRICSITICDCDSYLQFGTPASLLRRTSLWLIVDGIMGWDSPYGTSSVGWKPLFLGVGALDSVGHASEWLVYFLILVLMML